MKNDTAVEHNRGTNRTRSCRQGNFRSLIQNLPEEFPGAVGEPLPLTPEAAIAGDLRRSEKPCGRAGKATTRPLDLPKDVGAGESGAEDRQNGEGDTNRAVFIGASSPPTLAGCEGMDGGGEGSRVGGLVCVGPWWAVNEPSSRESDTSSSSSIQVRAEPKIRSSLQTGSSSARRSTSSSARR